MISNLSKEAWDKKTIELGGSILQSWNWGEFQKSLGQKIHRFSADDFVCLGIEIDLPMGKKYIYCPRGPIGNVEDSLVDLKKIQENHDIIFTRLEPETAVPLPAAAKEVQPKNNWMLSLEKSEEELLIDMKPKTRYNINLAQRKGVVVKEGSEKDLVDYYKLMLETADRNKFKLHPQGHYFQMWSQLHGENLKLLLAYYQGQLLAGLLLSFFGEIANYLHGGSSQKLKETMSPYLLHWEAIKLARQIGCKTYDFGGIAGTDNANHSWAGISRFKKGFGGFEVNYPGAYDLVYSPIWYNVYKNARTVKNLFRR